jgi:hypothetical protein
VPSARRAPQICAARRTSRLAVLVLCGVIGAGSLAGCETTQEKAAAQRAKSERILEARAKRQAKRKHDDHDHHHSTSTRRGRDDRRRSQAAGS